jgi:hypothetical protein
MIALPRVVSGHGPLAAGGQVWAIARAELVMQWRRWGLWVAFGVTTGLLLLLTVQTALYFHHLPPTSLYVRLHFTPEDLNNGIIYGTTIYGVMFYGLVVALLVVDRLGRDQRLGMVELQRAAPQGYAGYILGKFLGNYLAVLVPVLLGYLLCALMTIILGWPMVLLQKFFLAFVLVYVPSSMAAIGLTFWLTSFLPLRVVQVSFSLLWFCFNIAPGWNVLMWSIFNPNGIYVYPVFFPIVPPLPTTNPTFTTSMPLALLNIAVLSLTGVVALCLTYGCLVLRRCREEGM